MQDGSFLHCEKDYYTGVPQHILPLSGPPRVSVVVPVFNDAERLQQTLEALRTQTYPDERHEVIVVDNGSTDGSSEVARAFDEVTLLYELDHLSSPYSARNRGIEAAKGDDIALLDATCVPVREWMAEGVQCLSSKGADLAGGNVEFSFQGKPTAGELFDSITNIRMRESVQQGKGKTANLFVRREVFDAIGLFPEGVRSGGDVRWTRRATEEGHVLVFCEGATVRKPARRLWALLKKQWRVAQGQPAIWRQEGREIGLLKIAILAFLPPSVSRLKEMVQKRGGPEAERRVVELWLVYYVIRFVMRVGQGTAILRHAFRSHPEE